MFKVYQAEIKKTLARPGIYVLAVFLAIILVLGAFVYDPTSQYPKSTTLSGNSVQQKYNDFIGDDLTDKTFGVKVLADNNLENSINLINLYSANNETKQDNFNALKSSFNNALSQYIESYGYSSQSLTNTKRANLITALKNINTFIVAGTTNSSKGSYGVVITKENYTNYVEIYADVLDWAEQDVAPADVLNHVATFKKNYENDLNTIYDSLKFPTLSESFVTKYTVTNYAILTSKLSEIMTQINSLNQSAISDNAVNVSSAYLMDEYANKYISEINTYCNLIKYELICNAFDILSTQERMTALHLSNYNKLNANTLLKKYSYIFENNKTETDFAYPLTIGSTSNEEANGYDYAYFVMRLFSFVIIVYAVAQACLSIAGEIKDGTMRYLAIRPVSRTKILFGKFISILMLSIILILFGAVVSLVVGSKIYGLNSNDILAVFNGSNAIILKPIVNFGIYLASQIVELIVYLSIALLLSCLLKSDLLSLCLIIVLYLVNTITPLFTSGANSWLTYYIFSYVDFYSLFGSAVYAPLDDFFNLILGSKVYAGTNLIVVSIICITLIVVPLVIANWLFKKKEL